MTEYKEYIDIEKYEINNIPPNINISTMCISCKINKIINIENIKTKLELNDNNILRIDCDENNIKTLLKIKQSKSKKVIQHKVKKTFFNQITIVIRIDDLPYTDINKVKKINLKLFKNGSIQMSGCKSIYNVNMALNNLLSCLNTSDNLYLENTPDEISVISFKIDMINSNYKTNIEINRDAFHKLLLNKKIKSSYESCIRACVIVKYNPSMDDIYSKEISIFIFEKGNIIITGAKSKEDLISSYNYINNIIMSNKEYIYKSNCIDNENLIIKIYDEVMFEIKNKLLIL